jgi:hypothetical protein
VEETKSEEFLVEPLDELFSLLFILLNRNLVCQILEENFKLETVLYIIKVCSQRSCANAGDRVLALVDLASHRASCTDRCLS